MKQWLTRNKIYFDTLAALSLTVMSLMLTVNSNRVSQQSLTLQRAVTQPSFRLETAYWGVPIGPEHNNIVHYLVNDGERAYNLRVTVASYLFFPRRQGQYTTARTPVYQTWAVTEDTTHFLIHAPPHLLEFVERRVALDEHKELLDTMLSACARRPPVDCGYVPEMRAVLRITCLDKTGIEISKDMELGAGVLDVPFTSKQMIELLNEYHNADTSRSLPTIASLTPLSLDSIRRLVHVR